MKYCTNCGKEIPLNEHKFCTYCGMSFPEQNIQTDNSDERAATSIAAWALSSAFLFWLPIGLTNVLFPSEILIGILLVCNYFGFIPYLFYQAYKIKKRILLKDKSAKIPWAIHLTYFVAGLVLFIVIFGAVALIPK